VDTVTVVVQVNGKVRDRHEVPADADEAAVKSIALASDKLAPHIAGKEIVKAIYVPGKLLNLVAK
jgi:leucyl-tRNA synthetase